MVDGAARFFLLEAHRAKYSDTGLPLNGMARLEMLLERSAPNSSTAFTLMDSSLAFPKRIYASFEQTTKLIKLRMPLPQLILRPEVYQHLNARAWPRALESGAHADPLQDTQVLQPHADGDAFVLLARFGFRQPQALPVHEKFPRAQ